MHLEIEALAAYGNTRRTTFGIVYACAKARRPVITTFGSRRSNFRRLTDLPAYTARARSRLPIRVSIYIAVAAKERGRYVILRLGTSGTRNIRLYR